MGSCHQTYDVVDGCGSDGVHQVNSHLDQEDDKKQGRHFLADPVRVYEERHRSERELGLKKVTPVNEAWTLVCGLFYIIVELIR